MRYTILRDHSPRVKCKWHSTTLAKWVGMIEGDEIVAVGARKGVVNDWHGF